MITSYLVGMALVHGAFAIRRPHEDTRIVFLISLFWPLSILMFLMIVGLNSIKWEMDAVRGTKAFGFRRPTNPDAKGFAVTLFYQELQFFKLVK